MYLTASMGFFENRHQLQRADSAPMGIHHSLCCNANNKSSKTLHRQVVEKGVVMAKDSKKWEESYEAYKKRFPKSKYNKRKTKKLKTEKLDREPMQLLQEYREVVDQIKKLNGRRTKLKATLKKKGIDPVQHTRSDYYDRPILLYILRLEHNCWYIGMSRNVDRRFKAHKKGKTLWTGEHKPLEIVEVRETGLTSDSDAAILEDELTIEYARRYGVDRVRGGGYCQRKPHWPPIAYEPIIEFL